MTSEDIDLSLAHLQADLARIDLRIQREVRRWQLAGQDPTDTFRGLKVTDQEVLGLLARPLGASWGQTVDLEEESGAFATAEAEALRASQAMGRQRAGAG
jgi:hypothetical protein